MDEQSQNEDIRISADPKIRELREKIERAKKREEIARAAAAFKPEPVNAQPTPTQVNVSNDKLGVSALRTYELDAAKLMNKEKTSLVSINIAETKKHRAAISAVTTASRAMSLYVSIILVVAGASVLALIYYYSQTKGAPPVVVKPDSIISADVFKDIDISGMNATSIITTLGNTLSIQIPPTSLARFNLQKNIAGIPKNITSKEFMETVASQAPPALIRSFEPDFAIGVYNGLSREPFIIFKVASYENAYAGMLLWEKTLPDELGGFISVGAKVSASPFITPEPTEIFEDKLVSNKDTRIWRNESGATAILYSFIDKNTLLITRDEAALKAISTKLVTTQYIR